MGQCVNNAPSEMLLLFWTASIRNRHHYLGCLTWVHRHKYHINILLKTLILSSKIKLQAPISIRSLIRRTNTVTRCIKNMKSKFDNYIFCHLKRTTFSNSCHLKQGSIYIYIYIEAIVMTKHTINTWNKFDMNRLKYRHLICHTPCPTLNRYIGFNHTLPRSQGWGLEHDMINLFT